VFRPRKFYYSTILPTVTVVECPTPDAFAELRSANIGVKVTASDFRGLSPAEIHENFLFAVARFLQIISNENDIPFVALLDAAVQTAVRPALYSWLFLNFNPLEVGARFFTRFFGSVTLYIRTAVDIVDQARLGGLLGTLDYLVTVAYVTVLAKVARKPPALASPVRMRLVLDFCTATAAAIATLSTYTATIVINREFVAFLDLLGAHCDPTAFHELYSAYLAALADARPFAGCRSPRSPIAASAVRLALNSLHWIATTPAFLDSLGRVESRMPNLILVLYRQVLATDDTVTIRK
jgi:hypothetical protein